ncbi:MAG: bifunctional sulfate adenylyltransferase/adenylylsulfate kinase [Proteobacteria bacterium]|nr:bifunctional sulfate adenylyltransferase/adenylylsulfate kinase [Pseudomonadota bacterium]
MNDYSENLLVHFRRVESLKNEAINYVSVDLNKRQLCDLELLINRAYYPLKGYLGHLDYESVLDHMRLQDGTVFPMPVCLDVNDKIAGQIKVNDKVALRDQEGFLLAVLTVSDIFKPDKKKEAMKIFGTDDPDNHPGVRQFYHTVKDVYLGGMIEGIHLPVHYDFKEMRYTPSETHRKFSQNGWRNVIGFHVEGPLHCREKEMSLLAAREAGGSIFMQPTVGLKHPGDLDHYTVVRCHQEFSKKYPKNMMLLSLITLQKRGAGPREALWQAVVRRNYGCTHFMVTEDHADPFDHSDINRFYPLGAARELVEKYEEETGIKMVPLNRMVYSEDKAQYISAADVKEGMRVKDISREELKRRLEYDLEIPEWFSYREVINEMKYANPPRYKQGFTVFMTGLSGAGKSTLAKILLVKFLEMRNRPVTLLDGDIVRRNLSSELSFSKEHRDLNIKRIGFVASEITKNGGIAICAPIAPYEESRQYNRAQISKYGGYIEVYLSTSISVCEQRDRKGIYAKAKAGKMKGVTGIDDPYISPTNSEITIDTSEVTPEEAAQEVFLYLEEQGYIR